MRKEKLINLLLSIGICFTFAIIGGVLTGDAFENWLAKINKPWFSPPLWIWYIIGGLYYIMSISILYRLFNGKNGSLKKRAIWLTITMVAGNEFWNYLFFGLKSPFAGFISLLPFTLLVIILFIFLRKFQRKTAWILFPYLIWLGFDIVWTYNLWMLNK